MINYGKFNKKIRSTVIITALLANMVTPISVQALGEFDIKSSFISKGINEQKTNIVPGITQKVYTLGTKMVKSNKCL